jgi:predicted enzyme related to lactoylglutathione lyase
MEINMDTPNVGQFCWTELATPNAKAAKEFYSKAFGWEFAEHAMDGYNYSLVKNGNKEFAGIWEIPKDKQQEIPPHWMSYILVDSLESALHKVQQHGAKIQVPETKVSDFGKFAIIIDPTGAHIALWESCTKK